MDKAGIPDIRYIDDAMGVQLPRKKVKSKIRVRPLRPIEVASMSSLGEPVPAGIVKRLPCRS